MQYCEPWQIRTEGLAGGASLHGFETREDLRHFDEAGGVMLIQRALEAGINFFDTANTYGDGGSEEVFGDGDHRLRPQGRGGHRDELYFPMRSDPNGRGLSRKAIIAEVDAQICGDCARTTSTSTRFTASTTIRRSRKPSVP